jgi:hypothetical protein
MTGKLPADRAHGTSQSMRYTGNKINANNGIAVCSQR